MRAPRVLTVLALAAVAAGCSSVTIRTDYAPQADFTKYRTYAWDPRGNNLPSDPRYDNSLVDQRIMRAVDSVLYTKGFSKADPSSADLLVVYHGVVEQQTNLNTINSYYGYDPYWGGYGAWGGWGGSTTYVSQYDEGTLIVDLMENVAGSEERLVWRGSATAVVKEANDPRKEDRELIETVTRMFAEYPPGGGS